MSKAARVETDDEIRARAGVEALNRLLDRMADVRRAEAGGSFLEPLRQAIFEARHALPRGEEKRQFVTGKLGGIIAILDAFPDKSDLIQVYVEIAGMAQLIVGTESTRLIEAQKDDISELQIRLLTAAGALRVF
jgi:hypothetical protein